MLKTATAAALAFLSLALAVPASAADGEESSDPGEFNPDDFNFVPKAPDWMITPIPELISEQWAKVKGKWSNVDEWFAERKRREAAEKAARLAEALRRKDAARAAMLARGWSPEMVEAIIRFSDQEAGYWQQGHRLLADSSSGPFSGQAEDDDGARIRYGGSKEGPFIIGNYTLTYPGDDTAYSGGFAGAVMRNGRATGAYVNGNERGNFTGRFTPGLGSILSGGFSCTSGCPAGED